LRNISTLLNASMIQMNQYMNICAATRSVINYILNEIFS